MPKRLHVADADAIVATRERQGLTRPALAERAGVDRSQLYRIEIGACEPRETTLKKIADALRVPLADVQKRHEGAA